MALNVPAGYYQCKLRWTLSGDPEEMICTIGIRPEALLPDSTPVDVAHSVWNAWTGAWAAGGLMPGYAFVGVDAHAGPLGGDSMVGSWDERQEGSSGASPPPQNCCILVKKRTALGGRHNVGRMFLPAGYMAEAGVSSTGEIDAGTVTVYQNCMQQFLANLEDATPTIPSPLADMRAFVFHADPAREPTLITGFQVDRIIATQRQRLRR